jgi:hypothetical protein
MTRHSNNELQNKSVEELQGIKYELEQNKRRTVPVPSQSITTNRQLQSMSVKQLQNLKKDLTSKPSAGIDKEFLINIKDSLEEYAITYLPNEYATLNKFQQNDYTTTSGTRNDDNCMDIYASNYNSDATLDDGSCEYPTDGEYISTSDINGDGTVDIIDVVILVNMIINSDANPESFIYIPPYHEGDDTSVTYNDIYLQGGNTNVTGIFETLSYPFEDSFWINGGTTILDNLKLQHENGNITLTMGDVVIISKTNQSTEFIEKNVVAWDIAQDGEWYPVQGDFSNEEKGSGVILAVFESMTINWNNGVEV